MIGRMLSDIIGHQMCASSYIRRDCGCCRSIAIASVMGCVIIATPSTAAHEVTQGLAPCPTHERAPTPEKYNKYGFVVACDGLVPT